MSWLFGFCVPRMGYSQLEIEGNKKIMRLNQLADTISERRDITESRIAECDQTIKSSMMKNQRTAARDALVRKKLYQKSVIDLQGKIDKLYGVINAISSAMVSAQIAELTHDGSITLNKMMDDVGGLKRVNEIMDGARDAMKGTDDLSNLVAEPLDGEGFDSVDLDDELNEYLNEDKIDNVEIEEESDTEEMTQNTVLMNPVKQKKTVVFA
jgi:hypothetical protein